ncbi:MAG: RpiB/LacA/LacB family sugar-phosphate isomerase, partial [Clostridia bacterium]|nr:RpiB/LacA/LacB family sugar-phosphate isomerase [Clostridia bacterium]
MKIAVGCDHGGLEHKNAIVEHLKSRGFEVTDFG